MPAVYPIVWTPPAVTGWYENLQRRDVAVWERFLRAHGSLFDAVAYNVAVGGLLPEAQEPDDIGALGWKYSTALKIDALAREQGLTWAIEVKAQASVSAIGAAIAYPLMLAREEPDLPIAGGAIVCGHLPPDFAWLAEQLRVRVWVV